MASVRGIFANLAPIRVGGTADYGSEFTRALGWCQSATICTGYVAAESLVELRQLVETFTNVKSFNLIVGMAKFDGLTRQQIDALESIHTVLSNKKIGSVYIATAIPVHAKVSLFSDQSKQKTILGSSNLGSLTRATRQYEVDVCIEEDDVLMDQIESFLQLAILGSKPLQESRENIKVVPSGPHPLDNLNGVQKVPSSKIPKAVGYKFEIPVGVHAKSGLNVFFGKGRKSLDGRMLPRPWYEVELIVPKEVTSAPGYPNREVHDGIFAVITDDGFKFSCKTSGDYSKNFRSYGDLETLGRWIKGKLEQAGVLELGEIATEETLVRYGRSSLSLAQTEVDGVWYLDFARPENV